VSIREDIEAIADAANGVLAAKNQAREAALGRCREAIRNSANAIRAVHRGDFDAAEGLVAKAGTLLSESRSALKDHLDIYYAGFVHDAEKEYAEAQTTLALISGRSGLPRPDAIGVEIPAYLNGLGEAVGELRRYLLDGLLHGMDFARLEAGLAVMDEIYGVLVTFDYPDAMTGGLRRTTDNVRGILERTRGDLALAASQHQLVERLTRFEGTIPG
jgi:translin